MVGTGRALVLGSGGVTGIAWEVGVLAAWAEAGIRLEDADRIIGTSAGAIVGAHLALGRSPSELINRQPALETLARIDLRLVWPILATQAAPDRDRALRWLARRPARPGTLTEAEFVARLSRIPPGTAWPTTLVVATVDTTTGRGRVLDASSGVDLRKAVAASAAVPGAFPAVALDGVPHFDGGLRSPANADLATGRDRVLALAPAPQSLRPSRRPARQLRALGDRVAWLLVYPDAAARRVIGFDALSASKVRGAVAAGRAQGVATADVARRIWAEG